MRFPAADLARAEFDAVETAVRYYDGAATAAEVLAAARRAQALRVACAIARAEAWRGFGGRPAPALLVGH
jgi:hypothetical protein